VRVGFDGHEHGDAGIDLDRIEHGNTTADDAGLLQPLDAPPTRRGGQANLLADFRHGSCAVLLQQGKDLEIHLVECHGHAHFPQPVSVLLNRMAWPCR
jgi:hypothetical protein